MGSMSNRESVGSLRGEFPVPGKVSAPKTVFMD